MRMRIVVSAVAGGLALQTASALAGGLTFTVQAEASAVRVLVGKAGLFKFAGHEHEVVAPVLRGEVVADPHDLAHSSVWLVFPAAALRVTGRGEPAKDVPKVQEAMVGPKVLDAARFPEITFRSRSVAGREVGPGVYELRVAGELTLHGVSRELILPLRVELSGPALTASGRTVLRHTDFGMRPLSVAGVVNVKNEIGVEFLIAARAVPSPEARLLVPGPQRAAPPRGRSSTPPF